MTITTISSIERIHRLAAELGLQGTLCIGPIDVRPVDDVAGTIAQPAHKWFASFQDKNWSNGCYCCSDATMTGAVLRVEDTLRRRVEKLLDEHQTKVDLARIALAFGLADGDER